MLEVTYNKDTKKLTAWNGDPRQFQNQENKVHKVVVLDIPVPSEGIKAFLFDEGSSSLINNPDYILLAPRNPLAEIDVLTARIGKLEVEVVRR